jgi:SagB-type dehydrogenase family enzyme
MTGGKPLYEALAARRSSREFGPKALTPQELSTLLWAAQGVNRPATGHRTSPSARFWKEIDIYVFTRDGVYRYEPDGHRLLRVMTGDRRAATGTQPFVAQAAVALVYVADLSRMTGVDPANQALYTGADAAFAAQNVYLHCASAGLACVVRGAVDRAALGKLLGLKPSQRVILAHSIGHPKGRGAPGR